MVWPFRPGDSRQKYARLEGVRLVLLIRKPRRLGLRHVTPDLADVQVNTPRFHVAPKGSTGKLPSIESRHTP